MLAAFQAWAHACGPRAGLCPSPVERQTGIEPALTAWKAAVLPLHHCRMCCRCKPPPAACSLCGLDVEYSPRIRAAGVEPAPLRAIATLLRPVMPPPRGLGQYVSPGCSASVASRSAYMAVISLYSSSGSAFTKTPSGASSLAASTGSVCTSASSGAHTMAS